MNKRLTLCLSLALLAAFAAVPVFAQEGTEIKPQEQQSNAPSGGTGGETGNVAGNTAGGRGGQGGDQNDGFGSWPMLLLIGLLIAMFVFSSRSRKKQEAKRREMLDAIKKGDTVTSIGGIIGTVVEVRERDVLIKIDDTTRIKLARWAVRGVGDDSMSETEQKKDEQK